MQGRHFLARSPTGSVVEGFLPAAARPGLAVTLLALAVRHGIGLTGVNLGGGMAVGCARPHTRFDWPTHSAGLRELTASHPDLTLRVEPGRALDAYCGLVRHRGPRPQARPRGGLHRAAGRGVAGEPAAPRPRPTSPCPPAGSPMHPEPTFHFLN
ncbi:hypothetical protein [Streptomyces sp. NPDC002537]